MVSRALIVCTHLRPGRTSRRARHIPQPITGLQIAAQLDPARFDITLYDEESLGPFDPVRADGVADIVFLTGLQPDFDRMRQLSYVFRRAGAVVVAIGTICSQFPEFAATFFDVVCAGGVAAARPLADDYTSGRKLRPIYGATDLRTLPAPTDHGFIDGSAQLLSVLGLLERQRHVRGWSAMVTPDILRDHALVARMAAAKCRQLVVGLDRFDGEVLIRRNATEEFVADIVHAERAGITIGYGLLFDPRYQSAASMEAELRTIAQTPGLPMPHLLSLACPLAGTDAFWKDAAAGRLAPDLRLCDLDGQTIAYSTLADTPGALGRTIARLFRAPWTVTRRFPILRKTLTRIISARSLNPIRWWSIVASQPLGALWAPPSPSRRRTYMAGENVLDPQYAAHPPDISAVDFARYFAPIRLTDAHGRLLPWLAAYAPKKYTPTTHVVPTGPRPAAPMPVEPVG